MVSLKCWTFITRKIWLLLFIIANFFFFLSRLKQIIWSKHNFISLNRKLSCTETCQKYSVTVIFYYIFHIKPQFLKTLFQSQFLFDFDEIFTNRSENVRSFLWFKIFFGSTDFKCSWFKHKLKLFVFKCTIIVLYFWRSKFCFVFKSWTHFCWWKNHQNRTRVDFGIMFSKNVVLHEIYSKKSQWPNTFGTSLYIYIQ